MAANSMGKELSRKKDPAEVSKASQKDLQTVLSSIDSQKVSHLEDLIDDIDQELADLDNLLKDCNF